MELKQRLINASENIHKIIEENNLGTISILIDKSGSDASTIVTDITEDNLIEYSLAVISLLRNLNSYINEKIKTEESVNDEFSLVYKSLITAFKVFSENPIKPEDSDKSKYEVISKTIKD